MSALTTAAAERIELGLAREYEKALINYTRWWRRVRDTPDPCLLPREAVRRLHESYDLLMLHEVLLERFGPEGPRAHVPHVDRVGELVTYVMSLLGTGRDGHAEGAVLDVLRVVADAMDAPG